MRQLFAALTVGIVAGASLVAPEIDSFRRLTAPGTYSLTFATLLTGTANAEDAAWPELWRAAFPGLVVAAAQVLLAAWLGAGLLQRILPAAGRDGAWGMGILPGSLCVLLAVRLCADVARATNPDVLVPALAGAALLLAAAAWQLRPAAPSARAALWSFLLGALLLLFGVQFGALHVTGDSSNLALALLAMEELPRIPLHHGDILWGLPAQRIAGGTPDAQAHWLTALWLWHAAARLALVWAAWLALHALLPGRPAWERAALTAFLCLGAHTLLPWHSPLVFNSGSPPLFALHPDTWATIALAWGAAAAARWPGRAGAAGLAMPLVSIGVLLGGLLATAGAALRRAPTAAAAWTLLAAALLPGVLPLVPSVAGLALTVAVLGAAGALLLPATRLAQAMTKTTILAVSFVAGTLLLGGLFDPFPHPQAQAALLQWRGLLFDPNGHALPVFGTTAPGFAAPNPYCGHFAGAFCADAPQALLRLGLPAALLALALWIHPLPQRRSGTGAALALAAVALAGGLVLVHWGFPSVEQTGIHHMASWLRTRLLEPGWMMALLLATALLARRLRPAASTALAVAWTLVPMTQDLLPLQIWINARWLLLGP